MTLVLVPGVLNLATIGLMYSVLNRADTYASASKRSRDILLSETRVQDLLEKCFSLEDDAVAGSKVGAERALATTKELSAEGNNLAFLISSGNALADERLGRELVAVLTNLSRQVETDLASAASAELLKSDARKVQIRADILRILSQIDRRERARSIDIDSSSKMAERQALSFLFWIVIINELAVLTLAFWFSSNTVRRVHYLVQSAQRLERGLPPARALEDGDELAEVSLAMENAGRLLSISRSQQAEFLERLSSTEQNLRSILQNIPLGIVEVSELGKILYANQTFVALSKVSAESAFGQSIYSFLPDLQSIESLGSGSLDLRLAGPDDTHTPVRLTKVEIRMDTSTKLLLSLVDITEELRVNRLKQDFTSMIVHDLRSPLSSIKGSIQLFEMGIYGTLNDAGLQQLARIQRSSSRLVNLVNDLLTLEKLEAGGMELRMVNTEVRKVIQAAVESVAELAAQAFVDLNISASTMEIDMDAERVIQVLVNLFSNAIRFSPPKSIIQIDASLIGDSVVFRVVDQGPGVPDHLIEQIFERFKQVDTSRAQERSGTGLGLAICKSIVDAHGGRIGCMNNKGSAGATFYFSLPIYSPP